MAAEEKNRDRIGNDTLSLRPNPDVIAQQMKDDIVLLNLRTNLFYELNRTAARLWQLVDEGRDLNQIREQLLVEFEVDPAQLDGEIQQLILTLETEGLVSRHEPS